MSQHGFDNLHTAQRLAAGVPGLLLQAEKVAQTFMKGVHGRRRVGMGEAFWQFRHYTPGDARRDIDWKQSAKRDDVFIKQREWEASQTLWLYRDASESMNFRSNQNLPYKKDFAEVLLLALSMIVLDGGERVSLLGTDLAPQMGYPSIERIYTHLAAQKTMTEEARPVAPRSHVVIMSDFYYDAADLAQFCQKLSLRGVSGTLIQICDPAELSLPYSGRMKFYDIENPSAPALTLQQVEALRGAYQEKFAAHRNMLADTAKACGWDFRSVTTDQKPETVLAALYQDMAAG